MNAPQPQPTSLASPIPKGRRWHIRLMLLQTILGIFPPFVLNRTRMLALRLCGVRVGKATLFWGLPKLSGPGPITSRLRIGEFCGFNDGCRFDLSGAIVIGNNVAVGHEVSFVTTVATQGAPLGAPITIEDGVWLGTRCTIMGGVTVGAGSVVGAGVTVSADVPPNTLLTGGKPVSLARWRTA